MSTRGRVTPIGTALYEELIDAMMANALAGNLDLLGKHEVIAEVAEAFLQAVRARSRPCTPVVRM